MNKGGGRVKAHATIMRKWFRQIPKNWQQRCAKTSASERRKAARHSRRSVPTKRVTFPPNRTRRKCPTRDLPDNDTHVERVHWPHVLLQYSGKEIHMFGMIAAVLVVLWLLGFLAFHVAGGLIHLLLVVAVIMVVIHFVSGRRAV